MQCRFSLDKSKLRIPNTEKFYGCFVNSQIYFHNTSINLSSTTNKSFKDW